MRIVRFPTKYTIWGSWGWLGAPTVVLPALYHLCSARRGPDRVVSVYRFNKIGLSVFCSRKTLQQLARGGPRHSTRSNSAAYACCQPVLTAYCVSSKLCLSSSKVVPRSERRSFHSLRQPVQMSCVLEDLVEAAIMLDYNERDVVGPWC